jgi:hypothetical protein
MSCAIDEITTKKKRERDNHNNKTHIPGEATGAHCPTDAKALGQTVQE